MRLSKVQLIILSSVRECTKNNAMRPLAQKGCAPLMYGMIFHQASLNLSFKFAMLLRLVSVVVGWYSAHAAESGVSVKYYVLFCIVH